jgi:hypothetical protein
MRPESHVEACVTTGKVNFGLAVVYWERSSKSPSSVAKSFLAEQFCKFSSSTLCITLY